MNLVPLIVMIVGFLACGMAFIKWQRRKELKIRAKKLKIAEGDFSEDDLPKPKTKKRKRRKLWLSNPYDVEFPSYVETELLTVVPGMVDTILSTRVAAIEHRSTLQKLELEYSAAVRKVAAVVLPQRLDRADMGNWWNELVQAVRTQDQLAVSYWQARNAFLESAKVHIDLVEKLQSFVKQMEPHDQDDLSTEAQTNFALLQEILRASGIGRVEFEKVPEKVKVPVPPTAPDETNDELSSEFTKLEAGVLSMLKELVKLTAGANALSSCFAQHDVVRKDPELTWPKKPVDGDINALLARAENWATQVVKQDAEQTATIAEVEISRLRLQPELASTILATLLSTINNVEEQGVKARAEAETARTAAQRSFGFGARGLPTQFDGKANSLPPRATFDQEPVTAAPVAAKIRRGWFGGGADGTREPAKPYVTSLVAPPNRWAVEPAKKPESKVWTELTAEQAVVLAAATRVHALTAAAVKHVVSRVVAEQALRTVQPNSLATTAAENGNAITSGAVASANRKLCFAVAQLNVANAKLQKATAEPAATVAEVPSTSAERDGVAYVRRFRQWQAAVSTATASDTKRLERVAAAQTQRDDRHKQLTEARNALNQFPVGDVADAPMDLRKQLLVAGLLSRLLAAV